jgi:hypothetical protein
MGRSIVEMAWRGRNYKSSAQVVLDAATAAACVDVARITLRGREAAVVEGGKHPGLNYPPGGPAPNEYITALLAAAPADDVRWLAAGSGEPRHAEAFAATHTAIAAYLEHIGHASAAAAAAISKGERLQAGYAGIRDVKGHSVVQLAWRGRQYKSSEQVVLDAATAAACADVARITLRGREAAAVDGRIRGLNFPAGGPAPNAYISALLAAAPADDARWLAASGEPRHEAAFEAAHAAVTAYLEHIGHASAAAAAAISKGERVQAGHAGITDANGHSVVKLDWRGRSYKSSKQAALDAATAAACADVARITLRGREAAIVDGRTRGLNFPPDGPAPNAYITALLAEAPADDARWLAAGSGEPRHADAHAAAHAAVAAYLEHIGHASAGKARARAVDAAAGVA